GNRQRFGAIMNAHETAESLVTQFRDRELNEADTRHQLIDPVLHDVLGWPRNRTRCELNAHPGFADYLRTRQDGTPALIIEAKREGLYLSLPHATTGNEPTS